MAEDLVSGVLNVGKKIVHKAYLPVEGVGQEFEPGASRARRLSIAADHTDRTWRWEISNSLRIIEGGLVVLVSFIFIVQSDKAIGKSTEWFPVSVIGSTVQLTFPHL